MQTMRRPQTSAWRRTAPDGQDDMGLCGLLGQITIAGGSLDVERNPAVIDRRESFEGSACVARQRDRLQEDLWPQR